MESQKTKFDKTNWMEVMNSHPDLFREKFKEYTELYLLNQHVSDNFSFPEEYRLAKQSLNDHDAWRYFNRKKLFIKNFHEDIHCYFSLYELFHHNTDNFTETYETPFSTRLKNLVTEAILDETSDNIRNLASLAKTSKRFYKKVFFPEFLVLISKEGEEVGEISIHVTRSKYNDVDCYKVEQDNNGVVQSVLCGGKSVGYVSIDTLETLWLRHHEYVLNHDLHVVKQLQIIQSDGKYVAKHVFTDGNETERYTYEFPLKEMTDYISNAAAFVIQRLLILDRNEADQCSFKTFESEGHLTYKHMPPIKRVLGKNILDVYGLKRCMITGGKSWEDILYYEQDGSLLSQQYEGIPIIMKSESVVLFENRERHERITKRKPLDWEKKDADLKSKFYTKKDQLQDNYTDYVRHRPEVKTIIHDFLQSLLIHKPKDVFSFAARHFSGYGPERMSTSRDSSSPIDSDHSFSSSRLRELEKRLSHTPRL